MIIQSTPISKQRGATLFVAMILLVMMTLFAISSINMSTINLKIVGNMQAAKTLDAEAAAGLERVITDQTKFTTPSSTSYSSTYGTVTISEPVCIYSNPATGYSALNKELTPEDNTWEIVSSVADSVTGATSTMHAGVEVRMLAGNCP